MRLALAAALAAAACGSSKDAAPSAREIEGTLTLAGTPVEMRACRPGRGVTTYVELVTARGKLRFEDRQLFWSTDPAGGRGETLACDRLERSWGGGTRTDGTSYFRGRLIFACTGAIGAIAGDVTVDCGGITPEERAQLDKNRQDLLQQQRGAGGTADGSAPGSAAP